MTTFGNSSPNPPFSNPPSRPSFVPGASGAGAPAGGSAGVSSDTEAKPRIQHTVATNIGQKKAEWKRKPNTTGTGATHVKTFHARLNSEALELLDQQVNAWLEEHPEIEVKSVGMTVGEWQGKVKEPNLIVQVWV